MKKIKIAFTRKNPFTKREKQSIENTSKKISFMKKSPLWMKFFSVSLLLMLMMVLAMTLMSILQMRSKESSIVQANISDSMSYAEHNLETALSGCCYKIAGQQTARNIYKIKTGGGDYTGLMRDTVTEMCNERSEIIAVFYRDNDGNCYSAGEVFTSISAQISMINECKSNKEFTKGGGLWKYAQAGRGRNAIAWCKDIIYVDGSYNCIELGTVIVYLDIDALNQECFADTMQTYSVVCDAAGTIVLAQDKEVIGRTIDGSFEVTDGRTVTKNGIKYTFERKTLSAAPGWEIMTYIEASKTGENVAKTMTGTLTVAFLGLMLVFAVSYVLSKRLGRPIEELLKQIKITPFGEISEIPDSGNDDVAKIRNAFDVLSKELKENIESNFEMKIRLKDITIKAYESQMNPHFLFNTLYMIQMMNVLGEKENVTAITNRLGKLLRFNLDAQKEVRLSDEIENVKNYLGIMELRFKGRFNYRIMIPPELMDCYAAKFMLQPFIENSVSHGFAQKKDVCEIVITAQQIGDDIAIVIKDNGRGITPERLSMLKARLGGEKTGDSGGIGMVNVHERIKLLYGEQYGVDIFSDYEKNTNVLIHIPVSRAPKTEADEDV